MKIYRKNITDEGKQRVTWAPKLLLPMDVQESMIAVSNGNSAEVYDLKKILETFKLNELNDKEEIEDREFNREDLHIGVKLLQDCHTMVINSCILQRLMSYLVFLYVR